MTKEKDIDTRSAATGIDYTIETALVGRDKEDNVSVYMITSQTKVAHITGTLAKMDADLKVAMDKEKADKEPKKAA